MTEDYIQKANDEVSTAEEEPRSLEEFLNMVQDDPSVASHASKYVLEAIEHYGTRTVVEKGEEKERYIFFDDPEENGEHAILGNTDVLNEFVEQLKRMASEEGDNNKIIWFNGPTATGKSELKRCFTNGLRGFSRTKEGRRYTMEWNSYFNDDGFRGMSYGEEDYSMGEWFKSPTNCTPLAVLPSDTQEELLESVNVGSKYPLKINTGLDPFSEEIFKFLKREYSSKSEEEVFQKATSDKHLRIVRNLMDIGDGIGILHAEDGGSPKERLVGSWMPEMMGEFKSRGRKNPQAFAYDGVLSQGNGGITVIEDARAHVDIVESLLNIPEESAVKLDKKIMMDVDTVLMLISNPDLEAAITQHDKDEQRDPLRALRRRLSKYELKYLTSLSLETQLLHRMLANKRSVWEETGEEAVEKVREPIQVYGCSFEPHAIETAAMFGVVSRIDDPSLSSVDGVDVIDKALVFEQGWIKRNGEIIDVDPDNIRSPFDGETGMPSTYTVEILINVAQENDFATARDVLLEMRDGLEGSPIFSIDESDMYFDQSYEVHNYIINKITEDVLEAMVGDKGPTEEEIEEYVDAIFEWEEYKDGDDIDEDDFDPYKLREFETRFLGGVKDEDYEKDATAKEKVSRFRKDRVISPINSYIYENRGEGFTVEEVPLREVPTFASLLDNNTWNDVHRYYENLKFEEWNSPPSGTETEELREKTLDRMEKEMGYTRDGAKQVTSEVIAQPEVNTNGS